MAEPQDSANTHKWRDKYLDALDIQERQEKAFKHERQALERALVRVSVAAQGQEPQLDQVLEQLRQHIRAPEAAPIEQDVNRLDEALLHFESQRQQAGKSLCASFTDMIEPLLAHAPPRSEQKSLRHLAKEVARQRDILQACPALLAELARLQQQVLARTQGAANTDTKPGLLSRWLGTKAATKTDEPPAPAQIPASDAGKADRALFELNPNATLRDSATVSSQLCGIITELLQSVEAQAVSPERVVELQKRLQSGIQNPDLIPVLDEVRELVMAAYMAATRAFAGYLNDVNAELGDIYAVIEGAVDHTSHWQQASDAMQDNVLSQFEQLQNNTRNATDLNTIKDQVQNRLGSIRAALDDYRRSADSKDKVATQLSSLAQRIKEMEKQAQENRQILQQQREKALHDALTGLPNRAAYNERVEQEQQRSQRYGNPLTLAVCDLDYFKKVNDSLGHQAGDRVLRVLSAAISKRLREVDFFCRHGGEEFVLLMPETGAQQAFTVLDRIRAAIAKTDFSYKSTPVELTVSIGIAEFTADENAEQVFARADKALYSAKAAGRNRCVLADAH